MLKALGARVWDRKWMLLIWLLFWALTVVSSREQLFKTPWLILFWLVICVCSFICVLRIQGMSARDFLLLAGLMGLFFIFIAPFPCIIDEDYHFSRAFGLSGGRPFAYWQDGTLGLMLPEGFEAYAQPGKWSLLNVWEDKTLWLSRANELSFVARTRSASYLPLDYVFSAVGIGIGRLFNLPLLFIVLLGRLTNYAAYVAVAYLTIRSAKYYGSLFFLVAVLPCCLYAGATISIDAPLIAFSLLYVSIALNYCLDDVRTRISTRDMALLLVSAAFILSAKYLGYCLLLPLILFAGKRGLSNFKPMLWMLGGVTLLIAAWQLWALVKFPGSIDEGAVLGDVSVRGQLAWAMENKGKFINLIGKDFVKSLPQRLYAYSYSEEPVFTFLSLPLRFVPFIAAARAKDKYPLDIDQRHAFNAYWLLAAAAMMLICNVAVYFAWNPVGNPELEGVQFRYTVPYMIFILLAFSTLSPVNEMKNWERRIGFLMSLSLINMVMGTLLYIF